MEAIVEVVESLDSTRASVCVSTSREVTVAPSQHRKER